MEIEQLLFYPPSRNTSSFARLTLNLPGLQGYLNEPYNASSR